MPKSCGLVDAVNGAGDDGPEPAAAAQGVVGVEEGGVDGGPAVVLETSTLGSMGDRPRGGAARSSPNGPEGSCLAAVISGVGRRRRRGTCIAVCRRERSSLEDDETGRRRPTIASSVASLSSLSILRK
jgi:hypothetical protein